MDQSGVIRSFFGLRSFYQTHFEHTWFQILLEDVRMDPLTVKDIRDFLRIDETWQLDESRVKKGVQDLESFISTIRQCLLPFIREKLRISYLKPENVIRDKDQFTIRNLIAQAVPMNLSQLEALTQDLKSHAEEIDESPAEQIPTVGPSTVEVRAPA